MKAFTLLFSLCTLSLFSQEGTLDATFSPAGASATVNVTAVQPDGKILIGGSFTNYNGSGISRLVRLNTDGSLDNSFNSGGAGATAGSVDCIALQSDGKILIGGDFTSYNGTSISRIARLNANGTLDNTFDVGTGAGGTVRCIGLQTDNKVLIGGSFGTYNSTSCSRIARLNTDGSLDNTFSIGSGANGAVYALSQLSSGKIMMAGAFSSYDGNTAGRIARLSSTGAFDATFNAGGAGAGTAIYTMNVQSDGKIMIGGAFATYNGNSSSSLARLNADGSFDSAFAVGTGANNDVNCLVARSDGKVVICGNFSSYNGTSRSKIARVNATGTIDISFDPGTGAGSAMQWIALQTDGKIVAGGGFTTYNGTSVSRIIRISQSSPLPVELVAFFAEKTAGDAVLLKWATASERENAFFVVEKSKDGRRFEEIGQVMGGGNSASLRQYSFADPSPGSGVAYYRLKQVDLDGRSEHSKIISVLLSGEEMTVFPNPARDFVALSFSGENGCEEGELLLISWSGAVVLRLPVLCDGGKEIRLAMPPDIATGSYFLKFNSVGGEVIQRRLEVVR